MTATLTADGIETQTFDEALEEIVVAIGVALSLTPAQVQRIRASVQSALGNLARIEAEREVATQEAILDVYETLSLLAEGAHLDRVVTLLGVERIAEHPNRVIGTADGTAATNIPNGTRLQYTPDGSIWEVVDGPYVIGGGGTVEIVLESEENEAHEVALDPDPDAAEWIVLDVVIGFSDVGGFTSTEQPIVGAPTETDAALRARASVEAYRRGQGPLKAIEAAVQAVDGVTFVRAWENRVFAYDPITGEAEVDANGIPSKAINVVVEGGSDADVAEAIFVSRPAGAEIFALEDGSEVFEDVVDDYDFSHTMAFNRITEIDLWIRVTATTSTSETEAPPDLVDTLEAIVLAQAPTLFGRPGDDVLPYKLVGVLSAEALPGIDSIVVELSLDDDVLDPYSATKRSISIRERAAFDAARIEAILA